MPFKSLSRQPREGNRFDPVRWNTQCVRLLNSHTGQTGLYLGDEMLVSDPPTTQIHPVSLGCVYMQRAGNGFTGQLHQRSLNILCFFGSVEVPPEPVQVEILEPRGFR